MTVAGSAPPPSVSPTIDSTRSAPPSTTDSSAAKCVGSEMCALVQWRGRGERCRWMRWIRTATAAAAAAMARRSADRAAFRMASRQ